MTDTDGLVDFEVPVVLLFRAPTDTDPDDLARFVENVLEHGTVRDVFHAAIDGAGREPLAYDGYSVPALDPPDPVHETVRTDLPSGVIIKEHRVDGVATSWEVFNPWRVGIYKTERGMRNAVERCERERRDNSTTTTSA